MDGPHGGSPLANLVGFTHALEQAGLAVTPSRRQTYVQALREVDVSDPTQVYFAGRLTLCANRDDVAVYDAAFLGWFCGFAELAPSGHALVVQQRQAVIAALSDSGEQPRREAERSDDHLRVAASDTEVLRRRDIAELSEAERSELRQLITTLRPRPPMRHSPRRRRARTGAVDARGTLRRMLATGGEPVRLVHTRRSLRPRRVVLLLDVSGSMSPYADALLRFGHVMVRGLGSGTEVFSLGTRMTRLTRALRQTDPERAMAAAGRAVPDWAGGTRLGETMRVFLDRYGQRGTARGAVVVVCSDGWERGDAELLGSQMARLSRLAHAVLWANPHAGTTGYRPVQSGIAAALPYVDKVVAGHSLAAFARIVDEVRDA